MARSIKATPKQEDKLRDTRNLVRAALFAALTAAGALLTIPIGPVPFTLQVMFTIMSGLFLGARNGAFSQVVYVMLGLLGLPVFSRGGAGVGILLGPTGGYLIGFICAAWVVGILAALVRKAAKPDAHRLRLCGYLAAAVAGMVVIYVPGVLRLATVMHISLAKAVAVGIIPFVGPDLAKSVAAALLVVAIERRGILPT